MTGERDARSEDRQLLLDAILAATQTLVITYTGANEVSGRPRPPAVPLGEVLDALDATASTADGRPVSEAVTIHHPLQPFDAKNVTPGGLLPGATFSFDLAAAAGARAASGPRSRRCPSSTRRCRPRRPATCRWPTWCASGATRSRGSWPATASTSPLAADEDQPEDALPGRDRQPRPVGGRRPGARATCWPASTRRSSSSASGDAESSRPGSSAGGCSARSSTAPAPCTAPPPSCAPPPPRAVDVAVDLGDGRRLVGTVPEVYGDRLVSVTYSRLGPKHRLASWVRLLALAGVRRGPQLDRPHDRPAAQPLARRHRRARCSGRSTTPLSTCCATWSRCGTAACGRRCRCR